MMQQKTKDFLDEAQKNWRNERKTSFSDLVKTGKPVNLMRFENFPVFADNLISPIYCSNPAHEEPVQMLLKSTDKHLCFVCPEYQDSLCPSYVPAEKIWAVEFCKQRNIPFCSIAFGYRRDGELFWCYYRVEDVDWKKIQTEIVGYDLKKDHDKLLKEIERLRKEGVEKMNELQQAVTSVKEEVRNEAVECAKQTLKETQKEEMERLKETLKEVHKEEIKRLNELREQEKEEKQKEVERLKKELEEVRKSVSPKRKRKHEEEEEEESSSMKKQKLESKTHCTPPDEKEFRIFLRDQDPLMVKAEPIARSGKYRGHWTKCQNAQKNKACCNARAKVLCDTNTQSYQYQPIAKHNAECLQISNK